MTTLVGCMRKMEEIDRGVNQLITPTIGPLWPYQGYRLYFKRRTGFAKLFDQTLHLQHGLMHSGGYAPVQRQNFAVQFPQCFIIFGNGFFQGSIKGSLLAGKWWNATATQRFTPMDNPA